jgi:hypothetical protein
MKFLVITAICVFAIILVLTAYNVVFQAGAAAVKTAGFPDPLFRSLNIDTSTKYGLIIFSAIALCFLILGFPRTK